MAAGRPIKTSLTVAPDLYARWHAAAALRGIDKNAFLCEALKEACRHVVVIDRSRKAPADPAGPGDLSARVTSARDDGAV